MAPSRRALAIVSELDKTRTSVFVFPSKKPNKPLSNMAMLSCGSAWAGAGRSPRTGSDRRFRIGRRAPAHIALQRSRAGPGRSRRRPARRWSRRVATSSGPARSDQCRSHPQYASLRHRGRADRWRRAQNRRARRAGPDRARRRWRRRKRWPIARRCAHGPEVDLVGRPGADEIVAGTGWLVRRGQRAAVRLLARGDRFRASVRPAARTPPPPRSTRVLPGRRGFRAAPSRRCTGSPRSAPADAPPSTCASNAFTSHNVLW